MDPHVLVLSPVWYHMAVALAVCQMVTRPTPSIKRPKIILMKVSEDIAILLLECNDKEIDRDGVV